MRKGHDVIMKSKSGSTLTFSDPYEVSDPDRNQLCLQKCMSLNTPQNMQYTFSHKDKNRMSQSSEQIKRENDRRRRTDGGDRGSRITVDEDEKDESKG